MPQVPRGPGKLHAVKAFLVSPWLISLYAAIAISAASLLLSAVDSNSAGNAQVLQMPGNIQLSNQGTTSAPTGQGSQPECEDLGPNTYFGLPAVYLQSHQVCPEYNYSTGETINPPDTNYFDPLGLIVDLVVFMILVRLVLLLVKVTIRKHKQKFANISDTDRKKLEKRRARLWMFVPAAGSAIFGALYELLSYLVNNNQPAPMSQPVACFHCPSMAAPVYSSQYIFLSTASGLVFIVLTVLVILIPIGIVIGTLKLKRLKQPPVLIQNRDSGSATQAAKGWNWGAFLLNWIWGSVNNVGKAYMVFIPVFGIYWAFVLGAKGNSWAWEHGNWSTVEAFKKSQKKWAIWSIVIVVIALIGSLGFWGYSAWSNSRADSTAYSAPWY